MHIQTVFNKLLSLQGAWVKAVRFDKEAVFVTVFPRARRHRCPFPGCTYSTHAGYDSSVRTWRAVSLGAWKVFLQARSIRLDCPQHGVLHERVAWAAPDSTFTLDFEEIVAWLAKQTNFTAITELMRISWETVANIVKRVVDRKLDDKRLDGLYHVGLDEVSYRKGHKYLTVLANHATGKVVEMVEGRSKESVGKLFDVLGPERVAQLKAVTMDMCESFISEVRSRAPQAEIAFDPFHVVKLANEALQEVRRGEAREIKGTDKARFLKGSRWALLKAPENLSEKDQVRLAAVAQMNGQTYRAYLLKEELRAVYRCGIRGAGRHLDAWVSWAARSRLPPFVTLAKTVRRHREGILAAIRLGLANGLLEGINNTIKMIQHRAFGFHTAGALMAMVHLVCGDIPTDLPRLPISN
jgi:transposase